MLEQLCKEDFECLLGQSVKVYCGESSANLEVKEVVAGMAVSSRAKAPFRFVLRSHAGWRAPQGTFRIEHPKLGHLEVFGVPIGPDGKGLCYEFIFN